MDTAVVVALLLASLFVRLRNLSSPLTEDHAFRQTQTAITVWTFVAEGIHPLSFETPVFGAPWRVPFEFPAFQIVAALIARAGVGNIDLACRLANLFFFYLSAWFVYRLCREHIESRGAGACILLTYVWLPFTIFWSRTSMIDYASVALALAYLDFFARWLKRRYALDLALAIASGCLAFLIKVTTMPIVAVAMAVFAWRSLQPQGDRWVRALLGRKMVLAGILAAAVVPLAVGVIWTGYADTVRRGSPATEWLSTRNLGAWNFGTWSQRMDWKNWAVILDRLQETFLPPVLAIFPLLGLWRAFRDRKSGGDLVLMLALGAAAAVAIFFNLYHEHNYYLMAVSPAVAFLAGFGFHWFCFQWVPRGAVRPLVVLAVLAFWQWDAASYLSRPFSSTYQHDFSYQVGRAIADATGPDERIIVEGHDWSPDFLYYARRKGLMWRGSVVEMDSKSLSNLLASDRYTTIVCVNRQSETARFWVQHRLVRQIGPVFIYKVANMRKNG